MTLGGLALAVGILVDDATVEIENINRNIAQGKEIQRAILDGAQQIAVPGLCLYAGYLHRVCADVLPYRCRALSVRSAGRGGSFRHAGVLLLSRTLVPTMAKYLLRGHEHEAGHLPARAAIRSSECRPASKRSSNASASATIKSGRLLTAPACFLWAFFAACLGSLVLLVPWLGEDFFPAVDSGQFKLHLRARTGTRIEETARLCDLVEQSIHEEIPARRDHQRHRQHRLALQRDQSVLQQLRAHWDV